MLQKAIKKRGADFLPLLYYNEKATRLGIAGGESDESKFAFKLASSAMFF